MPKYVFDTNHLSFFELRQSRVMSKWNSCPGDVVTTIVCVQELLRGRLGAIASAKKPAHVMLSLRMLKESIEDCIPRFPILPFDAPSESAFQIVRQHRPRIGVQDQRIAAIALANRLTLVTSNTADFKGISGLALDDWST